MTLLPIPIAKALARPFLPGPSPQPLPQPPSLHMAPDGLSTPRADLALLDSPAPQGRVPAPEPGIQGPHHLAPLCLPAPYATTKPLPAPSDMSFPGNCLLPRDYGQALTSLVIPPVCWVSLLHHLCVDQQITDTCVQPRSVLSHPDSVISLPTGNPHPAA